MLMSKCVRTCVSSVCVCMYKTHTHTHWRTHMYALQKCGGLCWLAALVPLFLSLSLSFSPFLSFSFRLLVTWRSALLIFFFFFYKQRIHNFHFHPLPLSFFPFLSFNFLFLVTCLTPLYIFLSFLFFISKGSTIFTCILSLSFFLSLFLFSLPLFQFPASAALNWTPLFFFFLFL